MPRRRRTDTEGIAALYEMFKFHHDTLKNRSALRKELHANDLEHIKISRKPLNRRQKGSKLLFNKWELNIPRVRTSGRFEKEPKQPKIKIKILPIITKTKMAPRRNKRRTKRRTFKKLSTGFPETKLVSIRSTHLCEMDPGVNGQTCYGVVNLNNPVDPFNGLLGSSGFSITSTEHHGVNWNEMATVYNNYEVISTKVSYRMMGSNYSMPTLATFIVPVSGESTNEVNTMLDDTQLFATRLRESQKRAKIKYVDGSTTGIKGNVQSIQTNIAKLEGQKNLHDPSLVGELAGDGTEAGPTTTPHCYFGLGSLGGTENIGTTWGTVVIEQAVLFTNKQTKEGDAL